jgi:hypothetical protein
MSNRQPMKSAGALRVVVGYWRGDVRRPYCGPAERRTAYPADRRLGLTAHPLEPSPQLPMEAPSPHMNAKSRGGIPPRAS